MKTQKNKGHWNYRIFRYESGEVGIHEAYYTNGKLDGWTQNPLIVGDSREDLLETIEMIKRDLERFPRAINQAKRIKERWNEIYNNN